MDLLTGIESRTSALRLSAPGPTREHIEQIIRAGTRAPDHGRLRPWRFVVFEGDARARLGDAMADILKNKFPEAQPAQLDAERGKPMRAPTIIAVAAKISKGKIPEIEQVTAVAAAVQNMFLAGHALGYGVMWKTGAAAYSDAVKAMLGLAAEDHIVALLYLGTATLKGPLVAAPVDQVVTWL
ncbi:MAG: nitroreductase [Steroidobacteraceae bacterium]